MILFRWFTIFIITFIETPSKICRKNLENPIFLTFDLHSLSADAIPMYISSNLLKFFEVGQYSFHPNFWVSHWIHVFIHLNLKRCAYAWLHFHGQYSQTKGNQYIFLILLFQFKIKVKKNGWLIKNLNWYASDCADCTSGYALIIEAQQIYMSLCDLILIKLRGTKIFEESY